MIEFRSFSKIPRYSREVIVTEKIDGTNSCIYIGEDGEFLTGSRKRWITPEDDNYGFSKWAHKNIVELSKLGPGLHFGEWWGGGCQRKYGLHKTDMRFSLFNVRRWCLFGQEPQEIKTENPNVVKTQDVLPECVGLVPILWTGNFDDLKVNHIIEDLIEFGSYAVPGFMNPEGIVICHVAGNYLFKKTIEKDDVPKSITS